MPSYWCRNCRLELSEGDTTCENCDATIAVERPDDPFSICITMVNNSTATMLHHLEAHFAPDWSWFDKESLISFLDRAFANAKKRFTESLQKAQNHRPKEQR